MKNRPVMYACLEVLQMPCRKSRLALLFKLILAVIPAAAAALLMQPFLAEMRGEEETTLREIANLLESTGSYYARQEVVFLDQQQERSYTVEQWCRESGEHRIELETESLTGELDGKQVIIQKEKDLYVKNPELGEFYPVFPGNNPGLPRFLLEDAWRALVEGYPEEPSPQITENHYIWEVLVADPAPDRTREKIWLSQEGLTPERVEAYDRHGRLSRLITFKEVDLEVEGFPDSLFSPGAPAVGSN